jgi:hypothetical protein
MLQFKFLLKILSLFLLRHISAATPAEVDIDSEGATAKASVRVPNVEWTFSAIHEFVIQKKYQVESKRSEGC